MSHLNMCRRCSGVFFSPENVSKKSLKTDQKSICGSGVILVWGYSKQQTYKMNEIASLKDVFLALESTNIIKH